MTSLTMARILVTFPLTGTNERDLLEDNVAYRPDLPTRNERCWARAVATSNAVILIVRRDKLHRIRRVLEKMDTRIVIVVQTLGEHSTDSGEVTAPHRLVCAVGATELQAERNAFALAEEQYTLTMLPDLPLSPAVVPEPRKIVLIGAGIVNLITAFELVNRGHRITVYDQCPVPNHIGDAWREFGATFGGRDGRIFSFNESRHHHAQGFTYTESTNSEFQRQIADGGWLARSVHDLEPPGKEWIDEFERVPPWLAVTYNTDIIRFNKESYGWWLIQKREFPELFREGGYREPLYRIYQSAEKYRKARQREGALGSVLADLEREQISLEIPALAEAVTSGQVAGALKVVGFSVNIHLFSTALIDFLSEAGVDFHWRRRLTKVLYGRDGSVSGIELDGEHMEERDYVVSLGAYGLRIPGLEPEQRQVGAVAGMWITLPNSEPSLEVPLKVTRSGFASDGAAEGANIIPGRGPDGAQVIHCSAGHGFVGMDPTQTEHACRRDLVQCVTKTASDLFPEKLEEARTACRSYEALQYCVRPWTASGLGLFSIRPTRGGGHFIYTGAHNTGGFAQSPCVAEAVSAALNGESHPMHRIYHPERCPGFLSCAL